MTEANKANRALELFAALRKSIDNEVNAKKLNAHHDMNNGNSKCKLILRKSINKNNNINDRESDNSQKINNTAFCVEAEENSTKSITSNNVAQHSESESLLQIRQISNERNEFRRNWEAVKEANEQLTESVADAQRQIKELQSENTALHEKLQTCTKELEEEKLHNSEHKEEWQKQMSLLQRHKKELSKRLYETECTLNKTKQELQENKINDKSIKISITTTSNNNNNNNNNTTSSERSENAPKSTHNTKLSVNKANEETTPLLAIGGESNSVKTLQMCIANLKEQLTHLSEQYNSLLKVQLDAALRTTNSADPFATGTTVEESMKNEQRNNNVHYINEEVKKLFVILRNAVRIQVEERQKEQKRANTLLYKLESKLASLEEEYEESKYVENEKEEEL